MALTSDDARNRALAIAAATEQFDAAKRRLAEADERLRAYQSAVERAAQGRTSWELRGGDLFCSDMLVADWPSRTDVVDVLRSIDEATTSIAEAAADLGKFGLRPEGWPMSETPPRPEDSPGLDLAYDFVQPSYQWALARFEAGNTRLQTTLAVIVSASLAVPALAKALNDALSFTDKWFLFAGAVFLATVAVGVYGRHTGTVALADPGAVLDNCLEQLSEAELKYNVLYYAADHFDRNAKAIERKWHCAGAMLALFVLEVALLLVWALQNDQAIGG